MTSVRRALALSLAERYLLIAIGLASNVILARLLTPEQIGIYSVSLAVIGIAHVLRDFGIGSFLIQEKHLTEDHIRTAFGISLLFGATLFVGILVAAPWVGDFYNEARMVPTLQITALNFLVLPFCTISLALLRREMAFKSLVKVTLSAAVVGFLFTIGLASLGFGPNSMAISAVLTNAATGLGAWLVRAERKMLLPALSQWRSMLNFGAQSSAAGLVTSISMDINDLAVGKVLGFAPVAMISRAQGLTNLFHRDVMSAVRNVALPAFAKAHREDQAIEPRYLYSVACVTAVAWPFYGFVALFALEVLRLMFGPQWDPAAILVLVFCAAGALAATSSLIVTAMVAVGRNDLVTQSELIAQPLRAALIVAAAVTFKSLLACALAYLIFFALYTPFIYAYKSRCLGNDMAGLRSHLAASAKVTLATLVLPLAVTVYAGWGRSVPVNLIFFLATAAATAVAWVAALLVFRHPITADPTFVRIMRRLPGLPQFH